MKHTLYAYIPCMQISILRKLKTIYFCGIFFIIFIIPNLIRANHKSTYAATQYLVNQTYSDAQKDSVSIKYASAVINLNILFSQNIALEPSMLTTESFCIKKLSKKEDENPEDEHNHEHDESEEEDDEIEEEDEIENDEKENDKRDKNCKFKKKNKK